MILTEEILTLYEDLCKLQEVQHIEAKKATQTIGDSVMQTICAFANTAGGYLLLGVSEPDEQHDGFWVSGVSHQDEVLNQIQTNCRNQFTHTISIDMGVASIDSKTVIAIKVEELETENKPCGFIAKGKKGKNFTKTGVWLRGLNNDYEATLDELKPFMMAQVGMSYEQVVLGGATLDDIEPKHIERYRRLRGAIKPNARELEFDDEQLLLALNVATEKEGQVYPNIAGLLLFGSDVALRRLMPMARVDYIRHAGNTWVEESEKRFLYTNDLREAIITMIPKLEANVMDDLPKRFELPPNSLQRIDTPILPQNVVREAVVNMLMHRDYGVHQPSQINRFSDRIELTNAGYSLKPVEKILDGTKGSQLRNPIIAQVLYDLNFAETKGSGIATMNRGLKEAGLNTIIFTSSRQHNESETVLRLQQLIDEGEMAWLHQFDTPKDTEAEVLILAKQMVNMSNKDVRENIGIDMHKASTILKKFCKKGYLVKYGKSRHTYYVLADTYRASNLLENASKTLVPATDSHNRLTDSAPSTEISDKMTAISDTGMDGIAPNTGHTESSTGHTESSTGHKEPNTGHNSLDNYEILEKIALPAINKKRLTSEVMQSLIEQLCENQFLTAKELSELLNRDIHTLRKRHLTPMVEANRLNLAYPNTPTHKNQAYRTTSKGKQAINNEH